ncbi:MAG: hypothetical protein IPL12_15835 [Bacteroidetes bacterium]|nr:hypothetical protein [Bacteroidota bacterium]
MGNLPEFEEAAQQVAVEFNVPEDAIKKIGLNTLLRLIMKESPNDEITPDNITEYIKLVIESDESLRSHQPLVWNIPLWISNIFIESDEIELE